MTTMKMSRAILVAAVSSLAVGCAPDQWVVVLSTDARVPQFGDQTLVEILDGSGKPACGTCRRQIPSGSSDQWPFSFGIAPADVASASELHVRARLFRSDHVSGEDGQPTAFLDAVGTLPTLDGHGALRLNLHLAMDCFGVAAELPPGSFKSCDPHTGLLGPESVLTTVAEDAPLPAADSWHPGQVQPCKGAPPPGMQCVPGGAFVLGGVHFNQLDPELSAKHERLVAVRPFFMDLREFTVQDLVILRQDAKNAKLPLPTPSSTLSLCIASNSDADKDNVFPLNCISRDNAAKICAAQGKRLPREAEWEFAAGNGPEETTYPWGNTEAQDICKHAVVGRGYVFPEPYWPLTTWSSCRVREDGELLPPYFSPICSEAEKKIWPDCEQVHLAELTALGIQDLAGNLSEWVADDFAGYEHPCWQPKAPGKNWLQDPQCKNPDAGDLRPLRGGSWWYLPNAAQVPSRGVLLHDLAVVNNLELQGNFGTGFRCVKDS